MSRALVNAPTVEQRLTGWLIRITAHCQRLLHAIVLGGSAAANEAYKTGIRLIISSMNAFSESGRLPGQTTVNQRQPITNCEHINCL